MLAFIFKVAPAIVIVFLAFGSENVEEIPYEVDAIQSTTTSISRR